MKSIDTNPVNTLEMKNDKLLVDLFFLCLTLAACVIIYVYTLRMIHVLVELIRQSNQLTHG